MKASTLYQPWATLIALGAKQIETRSWTTTYRGPLAIHAAAHTPRQELLLATLDPFRAPLRDAGYLTPDALPTGVIIAIANLAAIHDIVDTGTILVRGQYSTEHIVPEPERTFGDYTPGRHAWMLPHVARFETPIPARGRQRLWDWRPFRCPVCGSFSVIAELGLCQPCWNENAPALGLSANSADPCSHPEQRPEPVEGLVEGQGT